MSSSDFGAEDVDAEDMDAELAENPRSFQLRSLRQAGVRIWHGLLQGLTPARCLACGEGVLESPTLCAMCWAKMHLLEEPVCDVMGTPFAYDQGEGSLSPAALAHPPAWSRARASTIFDDVSKRITHSFKYGDRGEAGLFMARLMTRAGQRLLSEADLIIPVPLHWTRLWKRRFNQAAFLAQKIGQASGKPHAPDILKRIKATPQQVGLNAEARRKNVRKAFQVVRPAAISGRNILLIDDVRTTGATITACVEALLAAEAARVDVLTFALVNMPFRPHIDQS